MKNHDSDQKGKGWLPGCSDLAELAQGQEAILQILFDTSREGIFVLDIEGRVCKANQKFASIRWTPESRQKPPEFKLHMELL